MTAMRPLYLTAFFLISIMAVGHYDRASAQDVSDAHMEAARKAIEATRATESYDGILFDAASRAKDQFIAASPDLADQISTIVDEEAIALAPRRSALEAEAARLFANSFTEAELNEIAAFYGSAAGIKYNEATPILARELSRAARVWATGINRDLNTTVQAKIVEISPEVAAPVEGEAESDAAAGATGD